MRGWLLATVLLAMPLAAASQLGGDAGHAGIPVAASLASDVLGPVEVWPEGTQGALSFSPTFLPVGSTLRGAVAETSGERGCRLVDLDGTGAMVRQVPVPSCRGSPQPPVLAVTEPGWNLVCQRSVGAGAPLLLAVDDSGTELWGLSALDLVPGTDGSWSCNHAALDGDRVVLTATRDTLAESTATGDHVVAAIRAGDGAIEWTSGVSAEALASDQAGTGVNNALLGGLATYPAFAPLTSTVTESGYVVMGDLGGARAALLLDHDGTYVETIYSSETPLGRPATPARGTVADETLDESLRPQLGSGWGVAAGSIAYVALGPDVLGLDPVAPRPVATGTPELAYPFQPHGGRGPLLLGERIIVPMQAGILAVGRQDLEMQWQHRISTETGYWLWDVAATSDGDLWLAGVANGRDETVVLQRLDARTGALLQALSLNLTTGLEQISFYHSLLRIVPLPEGFLVINDVGEAIRVGRAAEERVPKAAVSNAYPAVGDAIDLDVRTPVGLTSQVWWGDGLSQSLEPGEEATHRYEQPGDRVIRATTSYPDGRTGTAVLVVHVGGTPPQELTFLQQAFAPGRQDTTWGVIGIVIAFFGGIGAYAANHWRRRGVARHLRVLDRLRTLAASEPLDALDGLRTFRRELRRHAERGRIDGSQYASLLQEADRLGRAVEVRIWGVLQGRLGAVLRGAVEAALTDGHLSVTEHAALREALRQEPRLSERERAAFGRLLDGWPSA